MPIGMPTTGGQPNNVIEQQRRIGAEAEEHAVADRDLPGIAADDVPGGGGNRRQQQGHADVEIKRLGKQRTDKAAGTLQDRRIPAHGLCLFHALPINPCGRSHSSATNSP